MKTKLGKKIKRLAGTWPRMECPHCGYRLERVSRYCNLCGRPVGKRKEKAPHEGTAIPGAQPNKPIK